MNDITPRRTSVPSENVADFLTQLSAGIAQSRATTRIVGGGKPLLRMAKDGTWIIGPQNEEVEDGSIWLVNTRSMQHGYCCWVKSGQGDKNTLAGEVMRPMGMPKPDIPEPIHGTPFQEQRSFDMRCLEGSQAGLEVTYKTPSVGGMRAVDRLLASIQLEIDAFREDLEEARAAGEPDPEPYVFPALRLESEHYNHPSYGKTYNPVLEVVGWCDTNGNWAVAPELPEQLTKPVIEPEPVKPARVRKAPAGAVVEDEPAPKANGSRTRKAAPERPAPVQEPVSTTQAHIGQRRRPIAR